MIGGEALSGTQAAVMEAARVSQEDEVTQYDLDKINEERRRRGLPPLSRSQADTAVSSRSDDSMDMNHFLIGYMTGIPLPSMGGILGAAAHPSDYTPSQSYDSSPDSSPSSSSDSSSSSSDSSSSSSGGC